MQRKKEMPQFLHPFYFILIFAYTKKLQVKVSWKQPLPSLPSSKPTGGSLAA